MASIEGVGDEVTSLFSSSSSSMVSSLAWISTRTAEPPEHSFTSSTGPAPSERTAPSPQDTPSSSASSNAFSSSATASDGSSSEAPPTGPSPDEEGEESEGGGGARRRGGRRNMVVRSKFSNDTERTAQVQPQDTIGYIKRTYFAGQEQQVRLIYQGQSSQDDAQTSASSNSVHNSVLHCHISQNAGPGAAGGPRPADQVQVASNVGSSMVPSLVSMSSVSWYCQIQYRQFFTAPATASSVGITIFLSSVAFGVYRR